MGLLVLLSEREAEGGQQCSALFVGACGGGDGDVHASGGVDAVVVDLGEDQLVVDAEGVLKGPAGTAIHTDFQDKFVKAEVIASQDLLNAGSLSAARDKGLLRTEGKEYIVKDGDVIEFKI